MTRPTKFVKIANLGRSTTMRAIPLKAVRIARAEQQSLFTTPRNVQCRCFHTAPALRLPNPFSNRPETFPEPAEKAPQGPATDPKHGLYGFFRAKKSVTAPQTLQNHGASLFDVA